MKLIYGKTFFEKDKHLVYTDPFGKVSKLRMAKYQEYIETEIINSDGKLVKQRTPIHQVWNFNITINENGEKLVKIIEESEKKMLKVKRSVAIMANQIDGQDDIVNVEETKNGLVIE